MFVGVFFPLGSTLNTSKCNDNFPPKIVLLLVVEQEFHSNYCKIKY